jgi:tetratricopeptide (TPR) repeat protein
MPGGDGGMVQRLRHDENFYRKRLVNDPHDWISRNSLAGTLYTLARVTGDEALFFECQHQLEESLRRHPKGNTDALGRLATARMAFHGFKEAREIADRALAEDPQATWILAIRGDAWFGMGEYENARADYETLHAAKPSFATRTRLGAVRFAMGDPAAALVLYEEAATEAAEVGGEPAAWTRLMVGVQHLKRENWREARRHFAQSLSIAPDYFLAMEHVAESLEAEGRDTEAHPYLEMAIAIKRDPGLLERMAEMHERAGRASQAHTLRAEALQLLRDKAEGESGQGHLRDLAEALMDRDIELPRALELARRDLTIRRDLAGLRVMARALRLNGHAKEAVAYARESLRYRTTDAELWLEAHATLRAAGLEDEAESLLRQARQLRVPVGAV